MSHRNTSDEWLGEIYATLERIADDIDESATLWDRYAMAALTAAGPRFFAKVEDIPGVASDAAKLADSMLVERKKRFEK